MASVSPDFGVSLAEFAAVLLSERETQPRCRRAAEFICVLLNDAAVCAYTVRESQVPAWKAEATAGEIEISHPLIDFDSGTLGAVAEQLSIVSFSASDLAREEYAHLDIRRTFSAITYVPFFQDEKLIGVVEVISYQAPPSDDELARISDYATLLGVAVAASFAYEGERGGHLEALQRVTQLYDLQATFHNLLEMDELVPVVTAKVHQLFEVQAANLWLIGADDKLVLMSQAGLDPSFTTGAELNSGEGIVGEVADSGEPLLIDSEEDDRLVIRNAGTDEGKAFSVVAVPLIERESLVGVIELVNRLDGLPFTDTDVYLAENVAPVAAGALHNASLLDSERKIQILEILVKVSTEITSTLNLDRVLTSVVNGAQSIIPYERASIGLEHNGTFHLKAISGVNDIPKGDASVSKLSGILDWLSALGDELYINRTEDGIDEERQETRAKFEAYFDATGYNSFYALPLTDDQGQVGVLCMESSEPKFLNTSHLEVIKVLGAQATVALRNAALFKEVPLIGILEPLIQRKRRFLALPKSRQRSLIAFAAAAVIFLVIFPWPMRIDGESQVAPGRVAKIPSQVEGVIQNVYVREGDAVAAGTILAQMNDTAARAKLASAQAKLAEAQTSLARALSVNDMNAAGVQKLYAEYWTSEVQLAREELDHTKIRAAISGIVTTPHIEDAVGQHLEASDNFAEVSDLTSAQVDVAIDESDASHLQPGQKTVVKLVAYPNRKFTGKVSIVSPKAEVAGDRRVIYARVDVPNGDQLLRPGMQGRAKVSAGWHSSGYVFFRRPAMWIAEKLWVWFGV
jgi:RND family efflux transporter MFP subunit